MRSLSLFLIVCLLIGSSLSASAKPEFLDVFSKAYSLKAGGKLATASCNLCHKGGPPALNPYGADVKDALLAAHKKNLDAEILQSVAGKDSDGDGASNIDEIKADTLPGSADSTPAGTPKPHDDNVGKPKTNDAAPNPFAVETLIKPKHGNHPILVHFPIALFLIGFLFDVLGTKKKERTLLTVGYYNLLVAAIGSLPSIGTGLLAWQWHFGGTPLEGYLLIHLICGIVTSALLFTLWGMRRKMQENPESNLSTGYWILAGITALMITVTGHLGGFLAYG